MRMHRSSLLGTAIAGLLAFGVQPAPGAVMMGDELKTAITHAGFAEKYDSLKEVSAHLHHVLNCLVGPSGKMFDKMAGNPCQGQGNGILPDIKSKMGEDQEYHVAEWLARIAEQAISMGNLQQAKAAAHIIGVQLTAMSKM